MALKNEEYLKELASKEPAVFNEVFLNFQMDLFDHENELKKLNMQKSKDLEFMN